MDTVYRRQRYVYDFTRKYYLFGRDALIRELDLQPGQRLVEIGCGTARNLIAIAKRYPRARLYGLDASAQMLKTAQDQLARAGLQNRVSLLHGLAEELSAESFGEDGFEHAVFSYSLSMIPDWRQALLAAAKSLSQDGHIHIVDFGDLKNMPFAGGLRAWLALFHVTPRAELLEGLESQFQQDLEELTLLPGRYAFRVRSQKVSWDGSDVALLSQGGDKTLKSD